jgi:hypothetical protein
VICRSILLFYITWIRPLVKTYGMDSIPIFRPIHHAETLTGVLNHREFYDLFCKYMEGEPDPDKVLFDFYIDTHLYRVERDMSDFQRRAEAWRIWERYLSFPPHDHRTNILNYSRISKYEEPIKAILQDEIHHVNESLFEPLNHYVFTLLEDGAFQRFLASKEGIQMRQQIAEIQQIQDLLLVSGMFSSGAHRPAQRESSDDDDNRAPFLSPPDPPLTFTPPTNE